MFTCHMEIHMNTFPTWHVFFVFIYFTSTHMKPLKTCDMYFLVLFHVTCVFRCYAFCPKTHEHQNNTSCVFWVFMCFSTKHMVCHYTHFNHVTCFFYTKHMSQGFLLSICYVKYTWTRFNHVTCFFWVHVFYDKTHVLSLNTWTR